MLKLWQRTDAHSVGRKETRSRKQVGVLLSEEKKTKTKKTSVEGAPAVEVGYILGTLPMRRGWGLSP